jgi:hypothetical protein
MSRAEPRRPARHRRHRIARLFVVGHRELAGDLKDRDVMVRAIEANIPLRPLDSLSIRTNLGCR